MEVEYPLFVANFENIPYNAQNNADPKPNIKPCKDQLRPEFSNIPLTSKHPNKASIKQKIFMDVIFSLNIIAEINSANIGAKLNNNDANESDTVNAASL